MQLPYTCVNGYQPQHTLSSYASQRSINTSEFNEPQSPDDLNDEKYHLLRAYQQSCVVRSFTSLNTSNTLTSVSNNLYLLVTGTHPSSRDNFTSVTIHFLAGFTTKHDNEFEADEHARDDDDDVKLHERLGQGLTRFGWYNDIYTFHTDVCNSANLPEIKHFLNNHVPKSTLNADTVTRFRGYEIDDSIHTLIIHIHLELCNLQLQDTQ